MSLVHSLTKVSTYGVPQYSSYKYPWSLSVCTCVQPRIKTMERVLLRCLISFALFGVVTTSLAQAQHRLLNSSKLEMFVDELPDMPKILGFDLVSGVPRSKSLEIGMFNITCWLWFFPLYLLLFIFHFQFISKQF